MKKLFRYLFYLSILFLCVYLYKLDYIHFPEVSNYLNLIISFVFLLLGFFFQIVNWRDSLRVFKIKVTLFDAFKSTGMSMFMKYIPGKVMAVVGRASYVSEKYNCALKITTTASAITQILTILVGSVLGALFILLFGMKSDEISWIIGLVFLVVVFITFIQSYNWIRKIIYSLLVKFKKKLILPKMKVKKMWAILPLFLLRWLSWSLGFIFLAKSFESEIPFSLMLAFPLASVIGIIAVFSPGGIGIREGALASCLLLSNLDPKFVTGIVFISRLWFLIGEVLVFLVSYLFPNPLKENLSK